jgi:hypothetical protein
MQDLRPRRKSRGYPVAVRARRLFVVFLLVGCQRPALPDQEHANVDAGSRPDTSAGDALADGAGRDALADTIADATVDAAGCRSNDDCHPALEFCRRSSCAADARGACATRPGTRDTGFCDGPSALVCACDGNTYASECLASAAGVNVAATGACPLPDGGGATCVTNDECAAMGRYYCHRTACGDAMGTCQPRPELLACQAEATHVVCGCDHLNYASACGTASYGVSVRLDGPCPPLPSGPCMSQADCGDDTFAPVVFCKRAACGDAVGRCTPRGGACPVAASFVCGCDGVTHVNECDSDAAAVSVAYAGRCRSGTLVACDASTPCPQNQDCIPDPRSPCPPGAACPGICVSGTGAVCGLFDAADGGAPTNVRCRPGTCVPYPTPACRGDCGLCVYASTRTCDASTPCLAGELCLPTIDCDAAPCPSVCVVP